MTLQVSGMLWNRSLVMRDVETGSLWSHILGECMEGPLRGETLEIIPAVMTTWKKWVAKHPETSVLHLRRTSREYDREFYTRPERFVLGVLVAAAAKAYPFDVLQRRPVLQDSIEGEPVLVVFDRESTEAVVYSRELDGEPLTFLPPGAGGELRDAETGSVWDRSTGRATAGPLAGRSLSVVPAIVSYRAAWEVFHPASLYAVPGRSPRERRPTTPEARSPAHTDSPAPIR